MKMTTTEAALRNRFNHPALLPIWGEMTAALHARDAAKGRADKARHYAAYKAAGSKYRATKAALGF
jgi:hypothetical protein